MSICGSTTPLDDCGAILETYYHYGLCEKAWFVYAFWVLYMQFGFCIYVWSCRICDLSCGRLPNGGWEGLVV